MLNEVITTHIFFNLKFVVVLKTKLLVFNTKHFNYKILYLILQILSVEFNKLNNEEL